MPLLQLMTLQLSLQCGLSSHSAWARGPVALWQGSESPRARIRGQVASSPSGEGRDVPLCDSYHRALGKDLLHGRRASASLAPAGPGGVSNIDITLGPHESGHPVNQERVSIHANVAHHWLLFLWLQTLFSVLSPSLSEPELLQSLEGPPLCTSCPPQALLWGVSCFVGVNLSSLLT